MLALILWGHFFDDLNILIRMKSFESLLFSMQIEGLSKNVILNQENDYNSVEMLINFILLDNLISDGNPEWLHRMIDSIMVSANHVIKEVNNIFFHFHHS